MPCVDIIVATWEFSCPCKVIYLVDLRRNSWSLTTTFLKSLWSLIFFPSSEQAFRSHVTHVTEIWMVVLGTCHEKSWKTRAPLIEIVKILGTFQANLSLLLIKERGSIVLSMTLLSRTWLVRDICLFRSYEKWCSLCNAIRTLRKLPLPYCLPFYWLALMKVNSWFLSESQWIKKEDFLLIRVGTIQCRIMFAEERSSSQVFIY